MSATETDTVALRREIGLLRADVQRMQAELDRRDIEQVEIEGAIEYLEHSASTLRYVLGGVITKAIGRTNRYGGKELHDYLYPCDGPMGRPNGAAPVIAWHRPRRRWGQFGSLREMVAIAEANGVRLTSDERRSKEWLVRRLWRARLLPGSVDLHGERLDREASQMA